MADTVEIDPFDHPDVTEPDETSELLPLGRGGDVDIDTSSIDHETSFGGTDLTIRVLKEQVRDLKYAAKPQSTSNRPV